MHPFYSSPDLAVLRLIPQSNSKQALLSNFSSSPSKWGIIPTIFFPRRRGALCVRAKRRQT